jgi:chemotaxis protein histidine kinase CheA
VRNALVHGLEPSADRGAKGKAGRGSRHRCAYHQGSHSVIESPGDGRGIARPKKIDCKQVEKGVIAPGAVMTREEICALRVGPDGFILPSPSGQRAERPTRESLSAVPGQLVAPDRLGRFVLIHRVHRRFGLPDDSVDPWDRIVAIGENAGKGSAFLVDEMIRNQEVVMKHLGVFGQNLPAVAGAAILARAASR